MLSHQPEIFSITPSELSFYGKNNAVLTGRNLGHVIGVRLQGHLDCSAKEWVKKHTTPRQLEAKMRLFTVLVV